MRGLARNKRDLYYSLYLGTADIKEGGLVTGQKKILYSPPVLVRMNVSPQKGVASEEIFGINEDYTVTAITTDMSCPIDENSIVWFGITPTWTVVNNEVVITTANNYVVRAVAKSLNSIAYALKKVDVNV